MNRTIDRTVFITLGAVFLFVLTLAVLFVANGRRQKRMAMKRFSAEVLPLELESFRRPDVPAAENAAVVLRNAVAKISLTDERSAALIRLIRLIGPAGSWTAAERADAERLLTGQEAFFAELAPLDGMDLDRSSFEIRWEDGFDAALPNVLELRQGNRLLALEARLAADEGRPDEAWRAVRRMWALARVLYNESGMLSETVGAFVESDSWAMVADVVFRPEVDGVARERFLEEALEEARRADLDEGLRRALALESWIIAGVDETELAAGMGMDFRPKVFVSMAFWSYQLAEVVDDHRRLASEYGSRTFAELSAPGGALPAFQEKSGDGLLRGLVPTSPWTTMPDGLVLRQKATETQRTLAAAALAMLRAAREDGAYPPSIPGAPTSALDGSPLTWTPDADGGGVLAVPRARELLEPLRNPGGLEGDLLWRLPPPQE